MWVTKPKSLLTATGFVENCNSLACHKSVSSSAISFRCYDSGCQELFAPHRCVRFCSFYFPLRAGGDVTTAVANTAFYGQDQPPSPATKGKLWAERVKAGDLPPLPGTTMGTFKLSIATQDDDLRERKTTGEVLRLWPVYRQAGGRRSREWWSWVGDRASPGEQKPPNFLSRFTVILLSLPPSNFCSYSLAVPT